MTRIIWFSRHDPLECQKKELEKIFGKVELLIDTQPFSNADSIVERFKLAEADEMVTVAPLSVIEQLCKRGIEPLFAEMKVVQSDNYDVIAAGRKYEFKKFSRIKEIKIIKEEL